MKKQHLLIRFHEFKDKISNDKWKTDIDSLKLSKKKCKFHIYSMKYEIKCGGNLDNN